MQNKTNYPGYPRGGRLALRLLTGAGAMGGLVTALAAPAAPAPVVTITERGPNHPAIAARPAVSLAVARLSARVAHPRPIGEVRPAAFILQTAQRRLAQVATRENAGAGPIQTLSAAKPAVKPAAVTKAKAVKLAKAGGADLPDGDLKTAPIASDSRIRNFGNVTRPVIHGNRTLKVGESQVMEFHWVSKVAVGNPTVADVVALSDNQVLVNGKATGETNLFVWDKSGQHEFKVVVDQGAQDMTGIARTVSLELGQNDIQVKAINDSLFLFGHVKTAAEQQQAEAVAGAYTKNVHNFIQLVQDGAASERPAAAAVADALNQVFQGGAIRARALNDGSTVVLEGNVSADHAEQARKVAAAMAKGVTVVDNFGASAAALRQVLIHSRVIDVDRVKSRELGIDWGPVQVGAGGVRMVGEQPFQFGESRLGPIRLDQGGPLRRLDPIGFKLRALEQQNAARTLSEPNLLVMEGQKGGIHIGGEIPIPVAQNSGAGGNSTSITVEYKPFGIRLDVEVMSIADDGITMRISPEVSSLDYTNAVTLNGFNLPALRTRRADSVVKIKNGQTLAIGGLLQNDLNRQTKAIPILSKIPILGELFKSTRFQKGESELVILVTPELPGPDNTVSTPIPNVELKRPDANFKPGR